MGTGKPGADPLILSLSLCTLWCTWRRQLILVGVFHRLAKITDRLAQGRAESCQARWPKDQQSHDQDDDQFLADIHQVHPPRHTGIRVRLQSSIIHYADSVGGLWEPPTQVGTASVWYTHLTVASGVPVTGPLPDWLIGRVREDGHR